MGKTEREFLHDIASPLAVLDARSKSLLRRFEQGGLSQEMVREGLQKLVADVDKVTALLLDRRKELIAAQDPGSADAS
jgi:hypothetical protein